MASIDVCKSIQLWGNSDYYNASGRIIACLNGYTTFEIGFGQLKSLDFSKFSFLIDGVSVRIVLLVLRVKVTRMSGPDYTIKVLHDLKKESRVLILGGKPRANCLAVSKIRDLGHIVIGMTPDIVIESIQESVGQLEEFVSDFKPDLVLICLGQPKQELFAQDFQRMFPNTNILCVGAFIEFFSEEVPRAPILFRRFGVEWVWRLSKDFKRLWKRYFVYTPVGIFWAFFHLKNRLIK